jgi:hypothetical protein
MKKKSIIFLVVLDGTDLGLWKERLARELLSQRQRGQRLWAGRARHTYRPISCLALRLTAQFETRHSHG